MLIQRITPNRYFRPIQTFDFTLDIPACIIKYNVTVSYNYHPHDGDDVVVHEITTHSIITERGVYFQFHEFADNVNVQLLMEDYSDRLNSFVESLIPYFRSNYGL